MFAGCIGHLHISDDFGKEDQHLLIGAGIIDFSKVVKALKGIGHDDTVTLDAFSRGRDCLKMSKNEDGKNVERGVMECWSNGVMGR